MMPQQIVRYINLLSGLTVILVTGAICFSYFNPTLLISFAQIKNIEIKGNNLADAQKIREISIDRGSSLFYFDLESVAGEIKDMNWVKKVSIKKKFPNSLIVQITENEPFAYLLKNQNYFLIDIDGELIIEKNEEAITENEYLILRGVESEYYLTEIISDLNINYPDIIPSIKEMEFVERRRWNLIFKNNLLIKLPESKIDISLKNLKKLIQDDKILKSNIIEVDLRLTDRAIIKVDGDKLKLKLEEV